MKSQIAELLKEYQHDSIQFAIEILNHIDKMPTEGPEHNAYYDLLDNIDCVRKELKSLE